MPKTQIFAENCRFSQIHPFFCKFQHLEGAGNRRKPQIFAGNRRFSQKTAGNRRLGSVTLGASPLARPKIWRSSKQPKLRAAQQYEALFRRFSLEMPHKLPQFEAHELRNIANAYARLSIRDDLSGPLNRLSAILSLLQPLDRYRTPSAIGSAIGRPLSRPISHPNAGGSPQPPRSKPPGGLNRAIVVL